MTRVTVAAEGNTKNVAVDKKELLKSRFRKGEVGAKVKEVGT